MSHHTWSTDGYGVHLDELNYTKESVLAFLALAPNVESHFKTWVEDCGEDIEQLCDIDFSALIEDYESEWGNAMGIVGLIQDVFSEKYNNFTVCDDFDGNYYLLYLPLYPWQMGVAERDLTIEKIDKFIIEGLGILDPDWNETPDFHSVENGG